MVLAGVVMSWYSDSVGTRLCSGTAPGPYEYSADIMTESESAPAESNSAGRVGVWSRNSQRRLSCGRDVSRRGRVNHYARSIELELDSCACLIVSEQDFPAGAAQRAVEAWDSAP